MTHKRLIFPVGQGGFAGERRVRIWSRQKAYGVNHA